MRPGFSYHGNRSSASSTAGLVRAPRYGNIKASIDSGINMRKLNEKFPEAKINARFKKEENFRRMKLSTLLRLLDDKQTECLILDIRDKDNFQACHIKGALSYPSALLRRSVNVFTMEILRFMNKEPEKIIVFYDEDEHTGASTGNLFVEKGVENIFMLTGGLKEVALKCREMIEGDIDGRFRVDGAPPTPFSRLSSASPSRRSSNSSRMSSRMSSRLSSSSRIRV